MRKSASFRPGNSRSKERSRTGRLRYGLPARELSRMHGPLSNAQASAIRMPSMGAHLDLTATRAAVAGDQFAKVDIEYRLFFHLPFVMSVTTQCLAAVSLARLGALER